MFQRRFWFKQYLSYLFQSLSYLFLGRFCSWNKCFVRDQFTDGQHSFFLCQVWGELRYYQTTGECSESLQLCLQLSAGDCSVFQHRNVSNTNHPWRWVLWFCLTVYVICYTPLRTLQIIWLPLFHHLCYILCTAYESRVFLSSSVWSSVSTRSDFVCFVTYVACLSVCVTQPKTVQFLWFHLFQNHFMSWTVRCWWQYRLSNCISFIVCVQTTPLMTLQVLWFLCLVVRLYYYNISCSWWCCFSAFVCSVVHLCHLPQNGHDSAVSLVLSVPLSICVRDNRLLITVVFLCSSVPLSVYVPMSCGHSSCWTEKFCLVEQRFAPLRHHFCSVIIALWHLCKIPYESE